MSIQTKIAAFCFCLSLYAQNTPPEAAPSPSLKSTGRLLELRTYYAMPGKLEDIHKRFRDHTLQIFAKHGMTVVGFWGRAIRRTAQTPSWSTCCRSRIVPSGTPSGKSLAAIRNGKRYPKNPKPTENSSRRSRACSFTIRTTLLKSRQNQCCVIRKLPC